MPDRCESSCATVTSSPINGRSSPSIECALVESSSNPSWMRLTTATAVKPFVPLAMANRVSTAFGISYARVGEPVRIRQFDFVAPVDAHHAGETGRIGDRLDGGSQEV